MGKYLHNDWKAGENGGGEESARCGVVAVSSASHIQFKVAFADACLNNLQSTVGLPPSPCPFSLPVDTRCHKSKRVTDVPHECRAAVGGGRRGRTRRQSRSQSRSRHRLSAVRVFRLLSSLALFINMLQVYSKLHSPLATSLLSLPID